MTISFLLKVIFLYGDQIGWLEPSLTELQSKFKSQSISHQTITDTTYEIPHI